MWLEPEGLDTDVIYPNGISNSLEPEDQLRLLATIPGEFGVLWWVGGCACVVVVRVVEGQAADGDGRSGR